jgi:ferric-dicitrate binding protein FerR (iron transport regulator)
MHNSLENNYSNFTETDFINDPYFQDWVMRSSAEIDNYWSRVLIMYPEKVKTIEAARGLLQNVKFAEDIPDDNYIHQRYLQHLSQVEAQKPTVVFGMNVKAIRRFAAIAALVTGLILVVAIVFDDTKSALEKVVVSTNFGEIKKVFLPDGSTIVLNGHSNVTFSRNWRVREIWLNGEAFIDVKHLNNNESNVQPFEKFLVHGEGFTIEVLGTSFDVRQRRGKTEVVLQTGKIKLTVRDKAKPIIMVPGDIVSYVPAKKSIEKSTTVPENYSGWKEKKLLLNDPTLEEITNYLEDNYGKKIIIKDKKIKNKKIEGVIELDNLNDALFIISTVLNTDIERTGDQITIKAK